MAPCEDVDDDLDDWVLPTRVVSGGCGPPPAPVFVAGERFLAGDAVSLGSDGHLHLVRDNAVPFAVVGVPCSEGDLVNLTPGSSTPGSLRVLEPGETWSNYVPYSTPSEETLRAVVAEIEPAGRVRAAPVFAIEQRDDGVTVELVALARAGDRVLFREIAGCIMPAAEVDDCWIGTRARLGLPA